MPDFNGTHFDVPLVKVEDGDTIKVQLPGGEENVRVLCLDTEEKPGSSGSKPKTPFGLQATERAEQFFAGASQVTLEFPGTESIEICLKKYRGNFGREPRLNWSRLDINQHSTPLVVVQFALSAAYRVTSGYSFGN